MQAFEEDSQIVLAVDGAERTVRVQAPGSRVRLQPGAFWFVKWFFERGYPLDA